MKLIAIKAFKMEKRSSIFSNGSINGFNSALFLPSEFYTDSDSETCIPINEFLNLGRLKNWIDGENEFHQESSLLEAFECSNKKCYHPFEGEATQLFKFSNKLIDISKHVNMTFTPKAIYYSLIKFHISKYVAKDSVHSQISTSTGNSSISNYSSYTEPYSFQYSSPSNIINNRHSLQDHHGSKLPISMNTMIYLNLLRERQNKFGIQETNSSPKRNSDHKAASLKEGDWVCFKCSNLNYAFREYCNRCEKWKYTSLQ